MKPEIELIDLKEKLRKAKKEKDEQENYLLGVIFSSIFGTGLAIFIWHKKIPNEYWMYVCGLFAVLSIIGLIMTFFAYNWRKEAVRKIKKLKKQEKELKNSIK